MWDSNLFEIVQIGVQDGHANEHGAGSDADVKPAFMLRRTITAFN